MQRRIQSGFTIVELIVIIVVIAILATIVIVGYNAVQNQAMANSLKSDLENSKSELTRSLANQGSYPADAGALAPSNGATFNYAVDNTQSTKRFCLQASAKGQTYYITQDSVPKEGSCPALGNSPTVTWTERGPSNASWWRGAISNNGQRAVIAPYYAGSLQTTSDGGATWTARTAAGQSQWGDVKMNADGSRIDALILFSNTIRRSTDSGATWTTISLPSGTQANSLVVSEGGTVLVATTTSGNFFLSIDNGASWVVRASPVSTTGMMGTVMSDNGQHIYTKSNGSNRVFYSGNFGASWTEITMNHGGGGNVVATNNAGNRLTVTTTDGIRVSNNYGVDWAQLNPWPDARRVTNFTASENGQSLIGTSGPNTSALIQVSTDGGISWQQASAPAAAWNTYTVSKNGQYFMAVRQNAAPWIGSR